MLDCLAALLVCLPAAAPPPDARIANGWRGNGTGLWPDATPPLSWSRTPRGALDGLRAQADRPADDRPGEAPLVEKGLVLDWPRPVRRQG